MIKKYIRINLRNKKENRYYKTKVNNLIQDFSDCIIEYEYARLTYSKNEYVSLCVSLRILNKLGTILDQFNSAIDKGIKKNVFSESYGNRKKSYLAKAYYKNWDSNPHVMGQPHTFFIEFLQASANDNSFPKLQNNFLSLEL